MDQDVPDKSNPHQFNGLRQVLTDQQPFGPGDTESVVHHGLSNVDRLFDRTNLIYAQTVADTQPTYIIGRKGAGKTAFLVGSTLKGRSLSEVLKTDSVYHAMLKVLREYSHAHGQLFVDQRADIWQALFEQIAIVHAWRTASRRDPARELQALSDYVGRATGPADPTVVAEHFLAELLHHTAERPSVGLRETIAGVTNGGVRFDVARAAMHTVLAGRAETPVIVMDNLEDLHVRLHELTEVLAGLFRCVGRLVATNPGNRPFGTQICLPSELFDKIHEIAAAPEKDLQGRYLKIYWTARELLRLTGTRLALFLQMHHPDELGRLRRRADLVDEPDPVIALLRAALPPRMISGLDIEEDPIAYLLRHTQLLPRHLIQILNSVFTRTDHGSRPWAVTQAAVRAGTRHAEQLLVSGIFNAHLASFPFASAAVRQLSGRVDISFPANDLHRVYNQQGIRKLTNLDFDDFLSMLFTLGVLGVRFGQTGRYNKAHFQYTFDYNLTAQEDTDVLCFHPLFTRFLHERALPRLRSAHAHATYPYGCDLKGEDYRHSFGYTGT
ncbi:P-loop ATPase, Sll1717 family [Umezawaea sp.]|uniref:P-loop ATPase, Sll1717 family n=1 Tax=Umezawaea sp. TaxID=1955258 RepID=UPI002ED31816